MAHVSDEKSKKLQQPLSKHGANAVNAALDTYAASIKLVQPVACDKAGDTYLKSQKDSSKFYESITLPDRKTVGDKLNATPATAAATAANITHALTEVLKVDAKTTTALDEYKTNIQSLNQLIKSHTASAILHELADQKSVTLNALKAQQKLKTDALEAKFADAQFKNDIKSTLGVKESDLPVLKTQFHDALKSKHTSQLSAFEETINTEEKKAAEHLERKARSVAYLAAIRHSDESKAWYKLGGLGRRLRSEKLLSDEKEGMRKEMEDLIAAKKKHNQAGASISNIGSVGFDTNDFDGINIEDLEHIQTLTGRKITIDKDSGQFSIEFPSLSWYRPYNKKDVAKDMRGLVEAIRACGFNTIELTINQPDAETAKEQVGIAYAEALKAGFLAKDITIKVTIDGKEEVLKGTDPKLQGFLAPEELTEAKKIGAKTIQTYENFLKKGPAGSEMKNLKKELADMRQAAPPPTPVASP